MMRPCESCLNLTYDTCIECGEPFCSQHGSLLCPLCMRFKLLKAELAERRRLVPWQVIDTSNTALFLSVGRTIDPGARTEPMMKVEVR